MRNAFNNGLSVAQFAEVIGLNGWLIGGFGENIPVFGETKSCDCSGKCWFEYAYQRDSLSRYDVIQAIARAEAEFAKQLGYWPSPHYLEGVEAKYPGGANYRGNALLNPNGKYKVVKLPYSKVISVGKRTCELLGEANVVYETLLGLKANNSTGQEFDVADTFTAQLTDVEGVVDVAQIEAYFIEDDRVGQPLDEWRINPVTITYDADTTTIKITGAAPLLAKPALLIRPDADCLSAIDTEAYVTKIAVYRCAVDSCDIGSFVWAGQADCNGVPCGDESVEMCVNVIWSECGVVQPFPSVCDTNGVRRTVNCNRTDRPKHVSVNYVSGLPLVNGKMEQLHAQIIAYLAASYLDCELCACECTQNKMRRYKTVYQWKKSEGEVGARGDGYEMAIPERFMDNPFGLEYGAIRAWQWASTLPSCKNAAIIQG